MAEPRRAGPTARPRDDAAADADHQAGSLDEDYRHVAEPPAARDASRPRARRVDRGRGDVGRVRAPGRRSRPCRPPADADDDRASRATLIARIDERRGRWASGRARDRTPARQASRSRTVGRRAEADQRGHLAALRRLGAATGYDPRAAGGPDRRRRRPQR